MNIRRLLRWIGPRVGDTAMNKAVPYYRVSTARQGRSGLGLEAQRKAVQAFAKAHGFTLLTAVVETESGSKCDRRGLQQALALCKAEGATLLIAKLDRLARNVAFISRLMEAGVDFKAADNPYADKLIVHIMAAFAEHEREQISLRTRAALQAAKARGVQLGSYGRDVLSKRNKTRSRQFAIKMKPVISTLRSKGIITVRGIAAELNRLRVPTYRSGHHRWHPDTVHNLLKLCN